MGSVVLLHIVCGCVALILHATHRGSLDPACVVLSPTSDGSCCLPFVSQDAAAPGHYSNHMLDLCPCLMFHGFIKGDESGSQWLGRERGGECER